MNADGIVIVADLEAGIGTLTRLAEAQLDVVLVVVEPTPRSIEVGQRAAELAAANDQGRIIIVANRVTDAADEAVVRAAFSSYELAVVPADPAVVAADRIGVSPYEVDPNSPAMAAFAALALRL